MENKYILYSTSTYLSICITSIYIYALYLSVYLFINLLYLRILLTHIQWGQIKTGKIPKTIDVDLQTGVFQHSLLDRDDVLMRSYSVRRTGLTSVQITVLPGYFCLAHARNGKSQRHFKNFSATFNEYGGTEILLAVNIKYWSATDFT